MKIISHEDVWMAITPNFPETGRNWKYGLVMIWGVIAFILVLLLMLIIWPYNLIAWCLKDIKPD